MWTASAAHSAAYDIEQDDGPPPYDVNGSLSDAFTRESSPIETSLSVHGLKKNQAANTSA